MNKKFLMIFIFAIFFLSFVSSAPPITTVQQFQEGYVISDSPQQYLMQGKDYTENFFVSNLSNGVGISDAFVNCTFYLANNTGDVIFNNKVDYSVPLRYWSIKIKGGNFSDNGEYSYGIRCNSSDWAGYFVGKWYVTPNGQEATTGKAVFYIGLLFVLLFFLGISIYFFSDTDDLLAKVGSLGIAYLLLTAITFIGWQMANDFLISSPFLIEMLRVLFFVFIIGAFPLLIGMFAWYLIMLFQIKEIHRLMDKGLSFDEAKKRQGSKYK